MKVNSVGVRKGSWTVEEDNLLRKCIQRFGKGKWHRVPLRAGLNRCRKSCRLRWLNYLKPDIKRGEFTADEVDLILRLHKLLGNRWSLIAGRIPGRTANDIKNYWNTHLRKKTFSANKKVKEKTETPEKINVLKPRPRTFSRNSPWLQRDRTTNVNNSTTNSNNLTGLGIGEDSSGPISTLVGEDTYCSNLSKEQQEIIRDICWDKHLSVEKNIATGAAAAVEFSHEQPIIADLLDEMFPAEAKTGDSSSGDVLQNCSIEDDPFLSFDADFWSFVNTDQDGFV